MNRKICLGVIALVLLSCANKDFKIDKTKLKGVWSGLLFQTEAEYDSIVLQPAVKPEKATLYKNGKAKNYELNTTGDYLSFGPEDGVRFDARYSTDPPELYGVLTNALWSQSLSFTKTGEKWISDIRKPEIIDTDYSVFLKFYDDSSGILQAKIQSNKENRKLHFELDSVKISGNHIDFDITNDRFRISAKFDTIENKLLLSYGNAGGKRKIYLSKLDSTDLNGYQPLAKEAYTYEIPSPVDSFLKTATLEEVGVDPAMLDFMPEMRGEKYEHIHSILVTKNNKLAFEAYFHGYNRADLHDIRSSFKSIASLLLGRAMMENKSIDVNDPVVGYYPDYKISDRMKRKITVHHALTMSSGLKLEDEDEMQWNNEDWVGYKLNLPLENAPGKKYEYSSGGANLLTGVIQKSTKKYLPLFLYEEMLLPMGIQKFQMRTSPKGRGYLAGDFYLRPIDLTKFGLLVLNQGKWNDEQLVNSEWIEKSTQGYIKGSWPKNSDYGYLWRLLERKVGGKNMKTIEAWGNGGQFLIIIPEIEMTITFTGGNYNLFPEMEDKPFEILEKYILPAVRLENESN
ncbi:MAG: serine hydrolase [Bacteroidota bacterium]